MINLIQINKEYKKLIPNVPDSDYQKLKKSISQVDQWVPIIINQDGIVLDGHHMFKACNDLGIEPKIETKYFDNKLLEKKIKPYKIHDYETDMPLQTSGWDLESICNLKVPNNDDSN